ncbi:MAG: DUF1844 domain-containing protein [Acidobacteriota bacterium]
MSEDSSEKTVKVVDRRWFTADGELRDLPPQDVPGPPSPAAEPANNVAPPREVDPPEKTREAATVRPPHPPELGLVDLIDALAQPAAALLSGQLPGRGRDLEGARYYIDLLGVVRSRLGTPLTAEETRYLDDVLYQLRSLFVAATR